MEEMREMVEWRGLDEVVEHFFFNVITREREMTNTIPLQHDFFSSRGKKISFLKMPILMPFDTASNDFKKT